MLDMPEPEPNGFVRTLNKMGYMTSSLDPFSQAFVNFAPNAPGACLDVGAAYGVASLAALSKGASVIANDLDERHLFILRNRAAASLRDRLTLAPGAFPDEIDFAPGSLGAVLICRVLHFFDGPTIERSTRRLFQWLAHRGQVFVIAETPYLNNFQAFIPIYKARKQAGDPWPGLITDVMAVAPDRGQFLPPQIHFMDTDVLTRVFSQAGFRIERASTLARSDFPKDLQLDGRESVGLIAVKP